MPQCNQRIGENVRGFLRFLDGNLQPGAHVGYFQLTVFKRQAYLHALTERPLPQDTLWQVAPSIQPAHW